ncbi:DUF2252 domain-containing protein [Variovorax rhizosphaerae]|uniref:DUF2252 domain-containing protein n=1 Tax=Variovorax rhizosphaerae TaxID=1836200 RepID=A0ABU8WER8_9BURK
MAKESKQKPAAPTRPRLSRDEQQALGKSLREKCPRDSHGAWNPPPDRPSPLALIDQSNKGRVPDLIPLRMGRMVRTPFTFYRGAALNMAHDLANTPVTGLRVQACGDCHLMNFGAFATPERRMIFDLNDMDETLPAPWEWDLKRLAASFILACRDNRFGEGSARDAAMTCVRSYRERMAEYSQMSALDTWYSRIEIEQAVDALSNADGRKRLAKRIAQARARSVLEHDFPKLAAMRGEEPSIKDNPPLVYHPRNIDEESLLEQAREAFAMYRESIQEDRRTLIDRYELKDIAFKVVGVGSVGTFCGVLLLMANKDDPLFLQVKEARASVLAPYAGKSLYPNEGQRVVNGYRRIQSASDIFLGWTMGRHGRHYFVRQLKDMKVSAEVEIMQPSSMTEYAELCGWTLARAHARSGEAAEISGYLGKSESFDKAIMKFGVAYADQNEADHEVLADAVRSGRVEVTVEAE